MDQIDFSRIPLHARRTAAHRHDVTPHVLDLLSADPDPDVRMAVASHSSTPLESLQRLAGDTVSRVAARASIQLAALRTIFANERSLV